MKLRDHTLGYARQLLEHLPDSKECVIIEVDEPEFVIIVDSKGNADRIVHKHKKRLTVYIVVELDS